MSGLRVLLLLGLALAAAPPAGATPTGLVSTHGEATLQARTDLPGAEAARGGTGLELARIREDRLRETTKSAGAFSKSAAPRGADSDRTAKGDLTPPVVPPGPALLERLPYDATAPPAFA